MVARKRKPNENFTSYRINLKKEAVQLKERLKGKVVFWGIKYFRKWLADLKKSVLSKKTATYKNPDREKIKNTRAAQRRYNKAKAKERRNG